MNASVVSNHQLRYIEVDTTKDYYIGLTSGIAWYSPRWFLNNVKGLSMHPYLYNFHHQLRFIYSSKKCWGIQTGLGYYLIHTENNTFAKPKPFGDYIRMIHLPICFQVNLVRTNRYFAYFNLGLDTHWFTDSKQTTDPYFHQGNPPSAIYKYGRLNSQSFLLGPILSIGNTFNIFNKFCLLFEASISNNYPISDFFPGNGFSSINISIGILYEIH